MTRLQQAAATVAGALALAVAACTDGKPDPVTPTPAEAPLPPGVSEADLKAAADGNNAFAIDLYKRVAAEADGNVVLSPFSVRTALAMTSAGARGETAQAMSKLLHFTPLNETLHPAVGYLARSHADDQAYDLKAANATWPSTAIRLRPEFEQLMRTAYGAGVEQLDYSAGGGEQARQRINRWTGQHTQGHIPELLKPGIVNPKTTLVLTNAVYFKGAWVSPFDPARTTPGEFTTDRGERLTVSMMRREAETTLTVTGDRGTWLMLPYQGGRVAMAVGLPPPGRSVASMLGGLTAPQLAAEFAGMKPEDVAATMPRFRFEKAFPLLETLTDMGLPRGGDFSGVAPGVGAISAVEHAATIEVNEAGTVATAATAVAMQVSAPPRLTLDRPFAFVIIDTRTGLLLFLGHVTDPR